MKVVSKEEVQIILDTLGKTPHYLADKEPAEWDEYDKSNFNAIIRKTIYENKKVK